MKSKFLAAVVSILPHNQSGERCRKDNFDANTGWQNRQTHWTMYLTRDCKTLILRGLIES
jgi:hypothetical protein